MKKVYPSQTPEARRKANVEYRDRNREKLLQYDRERYERRYAQRKLTPQTEAEKAKAIAKAAAWRLANPERVKQANRVWREKNPTYTAPSEADRDAVNEKWRAAYYRNVDAYREAARRKRVQRSGATGGHTHQEWDDLLAYFGHRCVYCGASGKLTRDHVIPLSRRELNPTDDIDNILPACRSCNSRKKDKTDWEYRRWLFNKGAPTCSPAA